MNPEQQARWQIDAKLVASGWAVQTKDKINLSAKGGVAICELSFTNGQSDYSLFVDGKALGLMEANLQRTTRLCQSSILQKAFTGKLSSNK